MMKYVFPNWTEYLEDLFSKENKNKYSFPEKVQLTDLLDKLNYLNENKSVIKTDPAKLSELLLSNGQMQFGFTEIQEERLIENLKNAQLGNDQFIVIGDSSAHDFIKVDERIKDVLGIEPEEFNLARICGLDTTHELFHPEDIIHVLRITSFIIVVASLKGIQINPYKDYFRVRFRTGYSQESMKFTMERKIYLSSKNSNENRLIHFDVWTKTHYWNSFEGIIAVFESPESGKRNFISLLVYILNAMALGFSPKDLFLLSIINNHKSNKEQLEVLNKLFREKNGLTSELMSDVQFKHFKRYLTKKIDSAILMDLHPLSDRDNLTRSSLSFKATQLGLLKRPQCFEEILLNI